MKKLVFFLLFCLNFGVFAQRRGTANTSSTLQPPSSTTNKTSTTRAIDKRNSTPTALAKKGNGYWAFGLTTHTNAGIIGGLNFKKAWGKNENKLTFFELDLVKTEDYKEYSYYDPINNFSYQDGKINHLFTIRPELGKEFTLLKKSSNSGPQLKAILATGPSIGLLSPYYVNVTSSASGYSKIVTAKMIDIFNSSAQTLIPVGAASMFKGLSESKIQPGWHFKSGLLIDFNSVKNNYISLEFGVLADIYAKPVELIYDNAGRNTYTAAYLTFYLGKK
ncbi:hypothetical protein EOJ36_03310 [Sandaracinomonas limnophila]|uniref:Outer membrane protein beta-barrel domain-containing protein n=1 Tax=Sandaracinomonas limnophila TaxID=1862386 RepID=A0A437PXR2_9BACT|nr:hypothetical protein [Sandaracinomonas limnophila]RVU27037.1 hypothetical protein EOJ36_03310 [Sandaracinomonas limnophila]